MRKLVVTENITLDGSIEMLSEWFDPQVQGDVDNDDLVEEMRRLEGAADALLVGRETFEALRGYWRDLSDDTTGVAAYLNRVDKYVVSSTLTEPDWDETQVLDRDPLNRIRSLKEADGRDIVVTGSITLVHALIEAALVDEYRLFVYPTVQGGGRRLFPDGYTMPRLASLESLPFRSGITLLKFAPTAE